MSQRMFWAKADSRATCNSIKTAAIAGVQNWERGKGWSSVSRTHWTGCTRTSLVMCRPIDRSHLQASPVMFYFVFLNQNFSYSTRLQILSFFGNPIVQKSLPNHNFIRTSFAGTLSSQQTPELLWKTIKRTEHRANKQPMTHFSTLMASLTKLCVSD